ncbi:hypothetical protein JNM05_02865 [bacterium]|nr:hypothetical protein [bacterium]
MKWLIIVIGVTCLFSKDVFAQENADDAKEVFLSEKCQRCHSISAINIDVTGQKVVSDLSAVGSRHTGEWLVMYMKREVAIDGKKHIKNLKTSGANIEKLAHWLATLKRK